MAINRRSRPDALEQPPARAAARQSHVEAVLDHVRRMGESVLSLFTGLLAAVLILYSGYVLYDTFYTQNRAFSSSYELLQYRPEIIDNGAVPLSGGDTLTSINRDYRAWLTVYDTNIDYPVMQGSDNQFYANHDVYKNSSLTGAIYLAAKNSRGFTDAYNLVYGHHMDNGAMFGALDRFADAGYFSGHRKGLLVSSTTVYDLNIFATVSTDAYESIVYHSHETDLATLLAYIDEHAVVKDMAAARGARQILAMSTCATAETNGRLVVYATMTPRDMSALPRQDETENPMRLTLTGYRGVYDGRAHVPGVSVNMSDARVEYSIDGGVTWSRVAPSIRNVGTVSVMARAIHDRYATVTAETVLRVDPAEVTVRANAAIWQQGKAEPTLTAQAEGVLAGDSLSYTLRLVGVGEAAGVYPGAVVVEGDRIQGNYTVTYLSADYTVLAADKTPHAPVVSIGQTSFVYDGQIHSAPVTVYQDDALVEYSTDGGQTWTREVPGMRDVGQLDIQVRITVPDIEPVMQEVKLIIRPRPVTVAANAANKVAGEKDPEFTAQINGLIDGDTVDYTFRREAGEEAGDYELFAEGEREQGNYVVTFVSGTLTITKAPPAPKPTPEPEPEVIEEPETPLAAVIERFRPTGSIHGEKAWAIVNLLLLIYTVYMMVPLAHLKAKFGRAKQMSRLNGELPELPFNVKGFRIRFWIAVVLETILAAGSVTLFLLTEDMSLPMVLIDKWTPAMLLLAALSWISDFALTRVRQ